jgi:multisite-specific tRNA:(cytosine-C5)-methyltransferase
LNIFINTPGHQDIESIAMDPNAIAIVCWKGKTNLAVMLTPMDGKELLDRISFRFGLKIPKVDDGKPNLKSDGSDEQPYGGDETVDPECVPESKATDMEMSDAKEAE